MERNGGVEFCKQSDMEEFYQHGLVDIRVVQKEKDKLFQ